MLVVLEDNITCVIPRGELDGEVALGAIFVPGTGSALRQVFAVLLPPITVIENTRNIQG